MYEKTVVVRNKTGLHARPASLFVRCAKDFKSNITLQKASGESDPIEAKSILMLLAAAIGQGEEITIRAEGEDEVAAVDTLIALIESAFGEEE